MTSPPALLDQEAIEQLRMLEHRRPGLLQGVALRYVRDIEPKLTAIQSALLSGDATAVREVAHALKGDSKLLGADLAARSAEQLELAAQASDLSGCMPHLTKLRDVLSRTRGALLALPECQGVKL